MIALVILALWSLLWKVAFGHLFSITLLVLLCALCWELALMILALQSFLRNVASGHLSQAPYVGSALYIALYTLLKPWSGRLGLAWSSEEGDLRPPFFNNPRWFCFVYFVERLLWSSLRCRVLNGRWPSATCFNNPCWFFFCLLVVCLLWSAWPSKVFYGGWPSVTSFQ